jgi:Coenzyme PQQ synthesis protein D (PqqD)
MSIDRWVASPDAYSSQVGSDLVLMSHSSSSYYSLNGTGAFVWSLLQDPTNHVEAADAVFKMFDVERSRCEQDIASLFHELKEAKLIVPV